MRELHKGKEKGFTLVEILIALAIMSIITTAVYQLYISQYKTWISQDLATEMQQNARISIDQIGRDLLMVGYGVAVATAIEVDSATTASNASQIAFRFKETAGTSAGTIKRVMYWRDAATNTLYRKEDSATTPTNEATLPGRAWSNGQPLSENVTALAFTYFDQNGNVLGIPPTNAYRVKVSLTVETSKIDPITNVKKSYTLSTDVRPRNVGIEGVSADSTPPPTPPSRPSVTDPHVCEKLDVSWTAVADTAGDLAGYDIWYGTSANTPVTRIAVGNVTSYTLTGLDNGTQYYISIASRDTSGNSSQRSLEATTGNGSPVNDSTPDADEPGQPVGLDAEASQTGSPWVKLTWTLNSATYATSPGVLHTAEPSPAPGGTAGPGYGPDTEAVTYKIERKRNSEDDSKWGEIGESTSAGFTDTFASFVNPEEVKCTIFDYRIRAVNSCDPSNPKISPYSNTANGDGERSAFVDSPTNGTTSTLPSDATKPAAPTAAISKAGYRRTFLNWKNPSDGDLDHVVIRYATALGSEPPYPGVTENPLVFGGVAAENGTADGSFSTTNIGTTPAYVGGAFAPNATMGFTHYGSVAETPSLLDGYTYAYSIFAMDKCGNVSNATNTAQTTVDQCGEETNLANPSTGAPPAPANFSIQACDYYTFSWDRINDTYPAGVYDLAGFYIYKRQNTASWIPSSADPGTKESALLLNPASGSKTWQDLGIKPDESTDHAGKTYQYYTIGIDCNREQNSDGAIAHDPWASIATALSPAPAASEVITVRPGRPTFRNSTSITTGYPYTSTEVPEFDRHDYVNMQLDNTSAGSVWLKSIRVAWTYGSARVLVGKFTGGTSISWIGDTSVPVSSPANITIIPTPEEIKGINDPLYQPLKFVLRFTPASGKLDMRADTVTISNVEYDKTFTKDATIITPNPTCTSTLSAAYTVPQGPVVANVGQFRTSSDPVASSTSPAYWNVASNLDMNVSASVYDNSGVGLSSVDLYYITSDKTTVASASLIPSYTPISNWTKIPMQHVSGSSYALYDTATSTGAKIPAAPDMRVWYFIVATDNKGNFDVATDYTTSTLTDWNPYTFDYDAPDPCGVTPMNPTVLIGNPTPDLATGPSIGLSWTAPTLYTSGAAKYSTDTFKYRVYRNSDAGSYAQIAAGGCSGNIAGTSCTDDDPALTLDAHKYRYYVKTINACVDSTPTCPSNTPSCLSSQSNGYAECVGSTNSISVSPTSLNGGASFVVTVYACALEGDGTTGGTTTVKIDSTGEGGSGDGTSGYDNITVTESGDTGTLTATVPTTLLAGQDSSSRLLVNATDTITVDPASSVYGGPKTISVTPCAGSTFTVSPSNIIGGASFTVNIYECDKANNGVSGDSMPGWIWGMWYGDWDSITFTETGDTGNFVATVPTTLLPAENTATTLLVNATDTIRVYFWNGTAWIWKDISVTPCAGNSISVSPTTLNGGTSFSVTVVNCAKGNNGTSGETLLVKITSTGEGASGDGTSGYDNITVTESGDTGSFTATVPTTLLAGQDSSSRILVNATDTINVDSLSLYGGPKAISVTPCAGNTITVSPTTLNGGASFTVTAYRCDSQNNGASGETATVKTTSTGEGSSGDGISGYDNITVTETGDTGSFTATVSTTLLAAQDSSSRILVNATDTINVDSLGLYGGPTAISVTPCTGNYLNVAPSSLYGGASFTMTGYRCDKNGNGASGETVTVKITSTGEVGSTDGTDGYDNITVTETGDTGTFTGTVPTATSAASDTATTIKGASFNDTISVDTLGTFDLVQTIIENWDPCSNSSVPNVTGFAFNPALGSSNKNDTTVGLSWTAVSLWNLAGYNVYAKKSTDGAWGATPVCSIRCTPPAACATTCTAATSNGGALKTFDQYQWGIEAIDSCSTPKKSATISSISESIQ